MAVSSLCGFSVNRFVVGSPLNRDFSICSSPIRSRRVGARCLLTSSERESGAAAAAAGDRMAVAVEEELGPVLKFEMEDFAISSCVSIGLQGRADEVIFEATVRDLKSPLYNSRVVLRELTSAQAQGGGRALEVLKKLARRQLMYHSYATQVHGYVSPLKSKECGSFTLVHGYHGSYSQRHWLQLSDWLPTLEATLALDEEWWGRRVGDDTVGGPAITR